MKSWTGRPHPESPMESCWVNICRTQQKSSVQELHMVSMLPLISKLQGVKTLTIYRDGRHDSPPKVTPKPYDANSQLFDGVSTN